MFNRVIVPIDGSDFAWRALGPAAALARQTDAALEIVQVVALADDVTTAEQILREQLATAAIDAATAAAVDIDVLIMGETIASTIAARVEAVEGSILVMGSVGRGRSAALIGSVAEELLGLLFGPIVLIGPACELDRADFRGNLVVTVDGSSGSESVLPLAAAWGIGLEAVPWIVLVLEPDTTGTSDIGESSYPARLARELSASSHHDVQFEVLHDKHPDRAIAAYASSLGASLIVTSTHGRTGMARIRAGSVAMGIVHRAPCPVVLNRPPELR